MVRVQTISPRPQFNNFSRDTVPLICLNKFKLEESHSIVLDFLDSFHRTVASRVFVVEQFGIRRWKANEKANLMISNNLEIG